MEAMPDEPEPTPEPPPEKSRSGCAALPFSASSATAGTRLTVTQPIAVIFLLSGTMRGARSITEVEPTKSKKKKKASKMSTGFFSGDTKSILYPKGSTEGVLPEGAGDPLGCARLARGRAALTGGGHLHLHLTRSRDLHVLRAARPCPPLTSLPCPPPLCGSFIPKSLRDKLNVINTGGMKQGEVRGRCIFLTAS